MESLFEIIKNLLGKEVDKNSIKELRLLLKEEEERRISREQDEIRTFEGEIIKLSTDYGGSLLTSSGVFFYVTVRNSKNNIINFRMRDSCELRYRGSFITFLMEAKEKKQKIRFYYSFGRVPSGSYDALPKFDIIS